MYLVKSGRSWIECLETGRRSTRHWRNLLLGRSSARRIKVGDDNQAAEKDKFRDLIEDHRMNSLRNALAFFAARGVSLTHSSLKVPALPGRF